QRKAESSQNPQTYLTGLALESDIDANRTLEEKGIRLDGDGAVTAFIGTKFDPNAKPRRVTADVCLDVGATRVIDSAGADVTPPDRQAVVGLEVEFVLVDDAMQISNSQTDADTEC